MNQQRSSVSVVHDVRGIEWQNLTHRIQSVIGALNGLAAFYLAATLSWNHQTFGLNLLVLFIAPVATGLAGVYFQTRFAWLVSLVLSVVVGILLAFAIGISIRSPLHVAIVAAFSTLISAALGLSYLFKMDISEACILNLRTLSVIAVFGVIVYVVNDAPVAAARTPLAVAFTLVMSAGLLVGQLAVARRVQAKATGLSQDGLLYSGAGALTLVALLGSLGPVAAVVGLFVACGVLGFIFLPVLMPLVTVIINRIHQLQLHRRIPSALPPSTTNRSVQHVMLSPSGPSKWIVWGIILVVLFAIALIWFTRRRNVEEDLEKEPGRVVAPTLIRRDRNIGRFHLEPSDDPVRKRYQRRLQAWHESGYTIGRAETPKELLNRLPSSEKTESDRALTDAYEDHRYGK